MVILSEIYKNNCSIMVGSRSRLCFLIPLNMSLSSVFSSSRLIFRLEKFVEENHTTVSELLQNAVNDILNGVTAPIEYLLNLDIVSEENNDKIINHLNNKPDCKCALHQMKKEYLDNSGSQHQETKNTNLENQNYQLSKENQELKDEKIQFKNLLTT